MLILTLFYATDVLLFVLQHQTMLSPDDLKKATGTYISFVKKMHLLILEDKKCSSPFGLGLQPGHRDSKGCHKISTRMSAKQLYFPRISRAQRRPFSNRNPLFLEGSTSRLWKQLAR